MNKSLENLIELGVNLIIAVAVLSIMIVVLRLGRENVNAIEQAKRATEQAEQTATFGGLNNTRVGYGRVIELVTCNVGDLDIYVDSTVDGGAILISKDVWGGSKGWSNVTAPVGFYVNPSKRIGSENGGAYRTLEKYLDAQIQTLLSGDISSMFATGEWIVKVAINEEWVGSANGTDPAAANIVTGLRFVRVR